MNKHIFSLLTAIDYGYRRQKKYIDVFQTSSVIAFCSRLKKEGYIESYIYKDLKVHTYHTVLFDDLEKVNMRIFLIYQPRLAGGQIHSGVSISSTASNNLSNVFKAKPYTVLKIISRPSRKLSIKV